MYKAYKFRLYPNDEQKAKLNSYFGCGRFVYNHYLNKAKNNKYANVFDNINVCTNILKKEFSFLNDVDSMLLQNSICDLDNNMNRFFHSGFGYPKYKSKYDKNSYTTSAIYRDYKDKHYCNIEVALENRKIKLPKLKWVSIRGYRNLESIFGRIINATISRDNTNKYYVSVVYENQSISKLSTPLSIVGLDIGVKNLITLSDCSFVRNNQYLKKYEKRIKRLQRELSRKQKKSNNFYKCKERLARLYEELANARKYYLHTITKAITDKYDIIAW